jgi:membrane associated rhomboid family serine protease
MDMARPVPEPTAVMVARDRNRIRHAAIGAATLLAGLWTIWLAAWALRWPMEGLGIEPRHLSGLVGILTAPLVHASFEHLMSNTLPIGLLVALTLYCYPRAVRIALPLIWLVPGLGVWLFARDSVHVGASGVAHGLMVFLFVMGFLRRDRLAVTTSLAVFFLYGGMLLGVLPQEPHISFEYHLAGAVTGLLAALLLRARDPLPPGRRYRWQDEESTADEELELPRPAEVPVLWQRDLRNEEPRVLAFRSPRRDVVPPAPDPAADPPPPEPR